jgi:L-seryl-tRNA(Ser) seleniumtransferase
MDLDTKVNTDPRRNLPSVDRLIRKVATEAPELADWAIRRAARDAVLETREEISRGESDFEGNEGDLVALVLRVREAARRFGMPHPRTVLNASGVLLHTNLGRAPLAAAAAAAVARSLEGYSNLELDLETGRRGSRMGSLEAKLLALSGAEAAHVVNNNAAAVLLALNTLALGRSVVVSRGELVEIGGSFRVPSIMQRAGVSLCEVGTTNRTHLADYADAIGPETALLLKVHRSNFEQRGFVAEAAVGELAELARARGISLVEDLGSGTLLDLAASGLPDEAFAPGRLALGVDVICFSGDKLLGGPQAGILLGRREPIDAMRQNPLARALRVDKMTVAALDATLDLMLDEKRSDEIPVVAGLRASAAELEQRAANLLERVSVVLAGRGKARVEASEAAVGGGSLPEHRLPGWAVVIDGLNITAISAGLRDAPTPVLARVRDDALWLDVRTLRDADLPRVAEALAFAIDR